MNRKKITVNIMAKPEPPFKQEKKGQLCLYIYREIV